MVEAHDLFLQGREYMRLYTPEANLKAIDLFQRAVALDPNYGLAYAYLATANWERASFGWEFYHGTEWQDRMESAIYYANLALGDCISYQDSSKLPGHSCSCVVLQCYNATSRQFLQTKNGFVARTIAIYMVLSGKPDLRRGRVVDNSGA